MACSRSQCSDGAITGDELAYLKSVSDLFEFSDDTFRRIKASHLGQDSDDPYAVLGVQQRCAIRGDSRRLSPPDAGEPPRYGYRRKIRPARV